MHQIALILALGATSGLFSRSRVQPTTCPNGTCSQYVAAPAPTYAPKYGQPVAPTYRSSYYYAPQAAPAAAPATAAPRQMYYYPAAAQAQPTAACPTGTCPYRR